MAAPSRPFTVIADSSVDPDSPLTTSLMVALQENDIHLEEWLGDGFVAAVDHDHDNVNSAFIAATGGGAFRLITHTQFSSDLASDITFTGLDGNTDFYYRIHWEFIAGPVGSQIDGADIKFNGTLPSGTDVTRVVVKGTTVSGDNVARLHDSTSPLPPEDTVIGGYVDIHGARTVQSVNRRILFSFKTAVVGSATAEESVSGTGSISLAGNLTSLAIARTAIGVLKTGSFATLYKIVKA